MSRIRGKVIVVPERVTATQDGNNVTVEGPKGELTRTFSADIKIDIEGDEIIFTRPNDSKEMKTIHGTARANFSNMIIGVDEGFQKALGLIGVRYCAQLRGSELVLSVGYSHPVEITPPAGVTVEIPASTQVVVKGANKERAGELTANIRGTRPPESYKGKGIRYAGEYVRRREGETGR